MHKHLVIYNFSSLLTTIYVGTQSWYASVILECMFASIGLIYVTIQAPPTVVC